MQKTHTDQWLLYFFRGIFALLFGVISIFIQPEAFAGLVIFLGAFIISDALLSVIFSTGVSGAVKVARIFLLLVCAGLVVAVYTVFDEFVGVIVLLSLFAVWSFFSGLKEMSELMSLENRRGEGWYVISVLLCVLIAMLIFINPFAGTVTLAKIFGMYSLLTGSLLVFWAIRLKTKQRHKGRRRYQRLTHY